MQAAATCPTLNIKVSDVHKLSTKAAVGAPASGLTQFQPVADPAPYAPTLEFSVANFWRGSTYLRHELASQRCRMRTFWWTALTSKSTSRKASWRNSASRRPGQGYVPECGAGLWPSQINAPSNLAMPTLSFLRQCESDVAFRHVRTRCNGQRRSAAARVSAAGIHIRRRRHDQVLPSADFIHRRDTFGTRWQRGAPQHLAGFPHRARALCHPALAATKDQAAWTFTISPWCSAIKAPASRAPSATASASSPKGTRHLIVPAVQVVGHHGGPRRSNDVGLVGIEPPVRVVTVVRRIDAGGISRAAQRTILHSVTVRNFSPPGAPGGNYQPPCGSGSRLKVPELAPCRVLR